MRWRKLLQNMFGLDWRSLALMRMGLALVILADLAISVQSLRVFYTDAGVMPRSMAQQISGTDFELYYLNGGTAWVATLFALEAVFAVMMLVGYRTRLATFATWLLLMSRQARNPLLLFGADMLEHVALFWAMWLPLNRRYSVDAWLGRALKPEGECYLSLTSFAVVLQYMLIYIVSGILKSGNTWHVDHTAVYYALATEMYARPLGQWLNQFDWLTAWLTVITLYLELYGPLLFIWPWPRGCGRLLGCVIFGGMQIGFGVCMQMGLFWMIMIAFMLMLLPAEFWIWFAEPLGRWLVKKIPWLALKLRAEPPRRQEPPVWQQRIQRGLGIIATMVMPAIIFYMLLINYDTMPGHAPILSDTWLRPAWDSGLDQNFNMFAADPMTSDGWLLVQGKTVHGNWVDLRTGQSPPSFDHPASVADLMGDERWCSYLLDLTFDEMGPCRQYYVEYLARQWNATHRPTEQLTHIDFIYMCEIHGPNHTVSDPQQVLLWTEDF